MTTIKSYTDLQQSKKLAEILPLETADCFWDYDDLQKYHRINWFEDGYEKDSQLRLNENNVCAWSLAALLSALPRYELNNFGNYIQLDVNMEALATEGDETLLDLVVNMIIHLHELKML